MSVNEIKHLAVETIYLVPDSSEGQRCYLWCDDPAPGLDMDPSEAVEYLRKDVHDAIIAKQANAAKQGMDAAKKVAGSNLEQAKRLSAESSPAALESEREANAVLTAELEAAHEREAALARDASYHQQEIDSLLGLLRKTQTERDVHMAHSARVNEVLFKTFSAIEDGDESALPYDEYRDAFNDAPTASLARRDVLKQAEALEETAADTAPAMHKMKHWLLSRANDLRQQAEGHQ